MHTHVLTHIHACAYTHTYEPTSLTIMGYYIVIYGSEIWNNQRPCVQDMNTGKNICACQEEAMAHRITRLLNEAEPDTNDEFDF